MNGDEIENPGISGRSFDGILRAIRLIELIETEP
jgi:hypothetical protein